MKRFTETDKWQDPWFRKLPGAHKLVFIFLIENCNNAGFYEFDLDHVAYMTGLAVKHVEGALKGLERGIVGALGWVWVRNFLRHQKNEDLNPDNPAHRQIIALLRVQLERFGGNDLFEGAIAPFKGLLSPTGIGIGKVQRKGSPEGKEPKPQREPCRPTREEAIAHGAEIGMGKADVEAWFDHFESNGWRVSGRAPMKDWKAALRNGKRRAPEFRPVPVVNGSTGPEILRGEFAKPMNKPPEPPAHVKAARAANGE